MQVLIIEDEHKTAAFICRGLADDGFRTEVVKTGPDGLDAALARKFDLILLDVMLPGMNGWEVLHRLREAGNQTPVILLTVLNGLEDRCRAIDLGADGFLTKPFSFSELLAMIKDVLHWGPQSETAHYRVGDLEIDVPGNSVRRGGKEIPLNPKEFSLLFLLVSHRGEILSPARIAEGIWQIEVEGGSSLVESHVRRLRSKVNGSFGKELIHTVRGRGYLLEER